jgi:hypothetical protein
MAHQSLEARTTFVSGLESKSSGELFAMWLAEMQVKNDPLKRDFIADALAAHLRNSETSADALSQIRQTLLTGTDEPTRWSLARILGEAATSDTLQLLLDTLNSSQQPELRAWLLTQIVKSAQATWDGRYHEELSASLETSWRAASPKTDSVPYLATALAAIGAPSGLELLLSEVANGGQTVADFEKSADDKAWAAFESLAQVRNPAAISFLESKLQGSAPGSMMIATAGYSLSTMGQGGATEVLVTWVEQNGTDVSGFVTDWFSRMRDETSVRVVNTAIKQGNFANVQNKNSLQASLALWMSQRSENLRPTLE